MTTPTPDEQALTEQIARLVRPVLHHRAFTSEVDLPESLARAVLPVVKAAQREAWVNGHSWGWSDAHEHHLMPQPMDHDEWKLHTPNPHDPEETAP